MRARVAFGAMCGLVLALAGCRSRVLDSTGAGMVGVDAGGAGGDAGEGGPGTSDAGQGPDALLPLGRRCALSAECGSGFCAQGVCCETACTEPCWSCNQWTTAGVCLVLPPGTVCGTGACDGDAVVGQKVCDGNGTCRAGPAVICAPYTCDSRAAACRQNCQSDEDCAGTYCETGGRCHIRQGVGCSRNVECASNHCVSGTCCNTACADPCFACNLPNREGTCSPRPDGCPDASGATD